MTSVSYAAFLALCLTILFAVMLGGGGRRRGSVDRTDAAWATYLLAYLLFDRPGSLLLLDAHNYYTPAVLSDRRRHANAHCPTTGGPLRSMLHEGKKRLSLHGKNGSLHSKGTENPRKVLPFLNSSGLYSKT